MPSVKISNRIKVFLQWLGIVRSPEAELARQRFINDHPDCECEGTLVRIRNSEGTVVAVFYQGKVVRSKPSRYRLYRIDGSGSVVELPVGPEHPYWIYGRK